MTKSDDSAGTAVARTLASHLEGVHRRALPAPSADLIKLFDGARSALDECHAQSFFFGPLNLIPKIALGKLDLVWWKSGALLESEGGVRYLPMAGDRTDYWQCLIDLLSAKKVVLNVPEWAARALGKAYNAKRQQSEYVIPTMVLQTYRGGHLRNIRNLMHKCSRECTVETLTEETLPDYLALNRTWYRQNAENKFRTYDKTSIDWLLETYFDVAEVACSEIVGIRNPDGQLINFTIAGKLTDTIWSAYTERFDREASHDGANWYAWKLLADKYGYMPMENDGTADTAQLRRNKGKLSPQMLHFYTVSK